MRSRFSLILMSVAGAGLLFCAGLVFGLGVMSSPKGGQHKEIAVTNEPVKVARRETTGSGNPGHDLTPLTPVHPGTPAPVQTAQAPQPAPAPTTQAAAEPATAPVAQAPAQPAVSETPAAPPANATPVSLHAKNSCDVQACSRAYKSFRESDCTYQPFSGPRQLCVSPPPPAKEASRSDQQSAPVRVHRGDRDIEVQSVPRERVRVTDGALSRDEDGPVLRRQIRRDVTADGEDDGIDDSRVIVRRSDDDRGWHRSYFAPVEDDDDQ